MKGYSLLKTVCQWLLPFIILYGFYIVLNGDLSPGGGFQGGVVFASCYLMLYFIKDEKTIRFKEILTLDKWLFFILIGFALIHLLVGQSVLASMPAAWRTWLPELILVFLNLFVGANVTLAFWSIMLIFTEEGELQ